MIEKIIVLRGPSDSGKTTTLNKLAEEISSHYVARKHVVKEANSRCEKREEEKDHSYILVCGDKHIGICTAGDKADLIRSYTKPLLSCDVIVVAAHRAEILDEIEDIKMLRREVIDKRGITDGEAIGKLLSSLSPWLSFRRSNK